MHYEQTRLEKSNLNSAVEAARARGSFSGIAKAVKVDWPSGSTDGFELQVKSSGSDKSAFVDEAAVSIAYLEGVIAQGCRSSAIYSYLISLYAKLDDESPLFAFLTAHVPAVSVARQAAVNAVFAGPHNQDDLASPLDLSSSLRTVLCTGRHFRSAIKLYMGLGMREQAVELALRVDPSLARELAQDSVDLDERKRLWLMIAKNAASDSSTLGGNDVVSRVVSVLRDCGPDVLSIEDVLPFL